MLSHSCARQAGRGPLKWPYSRPGFATIGPTLKRLYSATFNSLRGLRDGVITGEGPTTKGRVHFSRALDADDAAWCARILTASAVENQPVSRAEAEALFEINNAATAHYIQKIARPGQQVTLDVGSLPSSKARYRLKRSDSGMRKSPSASLSSAPAVA